MDWRLETDVAIWSDDDHDGDIHKGISVDDFLASVNAALEKVPQEHRRSAKIVIGGDDYSWLDVAYTRPKTSSELKENEDLLRLRFTEEFLRAETALSRSLESGLTERAIEGARERMALAKETLDTFERNIRGDTKP